MPFCCLAVSFIEQEYITILHYLTDLLIQFMDYIKASVQNSRKVAEEAWRGQCLKCQNKKSKKKLATD